MPSQFIRKKVASSKHALSALSKTIIQINQKVGGTAWEVKSIENMKSFEKSVAQGALAISKGKKGFTLSFTGSVNRGAT